MFTERLKKLRENKNMLQKKLAIILNTTSQTISGWELGRTRPDYDTLIKISKYFNVSIDYLLGNNNKKQEFENIQKERDAIKNALVKSGYMNIDEQLTEDELETIMIFINANKKFIKNNAIKNC